MKYLALLLILFTAHTHAVNIKPSVLDGEIYPLKFEKIAIKPICPQNPNGISCKALGSVVKVKAKLSSCIDEELSFDFKTYYVGSTLEVDIIGFAKRHPMADDVHCTEVEYVERTFTISEQYYDAAIVINSKYNSIF